MTTEEMTTGERTTDRPLRIAVGGIHVECSTFSAHHTELANFRIRRGQTLLDQYDFAAGPDRIPDVDWIPLVHARALPGGPVTEAAYQTLRAELLERLQSAGPLDGLVLDLHGAMSVRGRNDIEASLASDVRQIIGPDALIAVPMDLHGNVSADLCREVDLLTAHRMAPHEDEWLTRHRAAATLVHCLRFGIRPVFAWVQIPVLLPGEKTSTRVEPARSLYGRLAVDAARPGVLDAALWVGYAWADEERCRAAVVVTGTDAELIATIAQDIAEDYFAARDAFGFVGPVGTLADCVDEALASTARPFLISDTGDNPTAGGSGDSTFAAAQLLADPRFGPGGGATAVAASVYDPAAIALLRPHAVGDRVEVVAGAWMDAGPAAPLRLSGVLAARIDDPDGGEIVDVTVGGLHVLITARRKPFHHMADFTRLGLDPAVLDAVVVKIGYLEPDLYAAARGWRMALTPGGVDQRLDQLRYTRLARPIAPLDELSTVDLTATLFGSG